ncbi:MAG TPA: AmmeMemoRadiSam system protein A [Terriglobales bacterium]|nr:AmmeMemoRadiSam system protein A [Terriglobales bacterium]
MLPQPENPPVPPLFPEYSAQERTYLLEAARRAIRAALRRERWKPNPPSAHLAEPRGAFTTLHLDDRLRGCVGFVYPVKSLCATVAETAVAAALHDPRFLPVTEEEAARLQIEISVLSQLFRIDPRQVEVGRHGLLVSRGFQRGLLLPQVAVEHGWTREMFLDEACLKAGLAPDAWKHGATVEAFAAEVFGDREGL